MGSTLLREVSMSSDESGLRGMLIPKAAADYAGMSLSSFRRWMKKAGAKKPQHYKIGTRAFFKEADLDNWIEGFKSK